MDNHAIYDEFAESPVDYRIVKSSEQLGRIVNDPRYWRLLEVKNKVIQILRVPLRVANALLPTIEKDFGISIASQEYISAAFTSPSGHQFAYPWGDTPNAVNAPFLMRSNPRGMGMNLAGLFFCGPENRKDHDKNGLWMVTAERDPYGRYVKGRRSGTAYNVGVFEPIAQKSGPTPGDRGALPGERGILPGDRGAIPGDRGKPAAEKQENTDFLTPAGIGRGEELRTNEGYLMVREASPECAEIYRKAMGALGDKISADDGIPLISVGDAARALGSEDVPSPLIVFGVVGHCLLCPNPQTITIPINGPVIAAATGIPVLAFPEFSDHRVFDGGKELTAITPARAWTEDNGRKFFTVLPASQSA